MEKMFMMMLVLFLSLCFIDAAFTQEGNNEGKKISPVSPALEATLQKTPAAQPPFPSFGIVLGVISKIDATDAARPILEVKSDADNQIHRIEVSPWTNVVKITDISELKTGDTVRVMTRNIEGKDVAMNVTFGKIKSAPMPMSFAPRPAPAEKGK